MLEVRAPSQSSRKLRWVRATVMREAATLMRVSKEIRFYAIIQPHEEHRFDPAAVYGDLRGRRPGIDARTRRAVGTHGGRRRAARDAGGGRRWLEGGRYRSRRGGERGPRRDGESQSDRLRGPAQA